MRPLLYVLILLGAIGVKAETPAITVRGLAIDFSPFTLVASPAERLAVSVPNGFRIDIESPAQANGTTNSWIIQAPAAPGFYKARVSNASGDTLHLNLFVTIPASALQDEALNGYRIGPAPPGHEAHPDLYQPPAGFIEVTEDMQDLQLSPHFTLQQLLCKQTSGYPKYLVLKESLLVLLEGLVASVRQQGYPAQTLGVISGYRTPWYNRKIGNVANSRHVYGDAMDLFVDVDRDGRMDDLNKDGIHNRADVDLLADIVEEYTARPENHLLIGGLGRYSANARHGGFVHVDTRGYKARW